jgi:hypothetical protein
MTPPLTASVAVGDRYLYTTPDKRVIHYRVTKIRHDGTWVTLVPEEPRWGVVGMAPASLATSYGWAREEGESA